MSGSGRKRVSKWDTKGVETQHLSGSDYVGKSGSYFREKDPEHARFYPEGRNGSRRSAPDDDSEHLISRQHSGEAWPSRSRVSHDEGDEMMGYYDSRKSSEQEESRQQYFRQSPSRDRPKTRRSGSRSYSRSRSRSPVQRVRRDAGGSYDRHKPRTRVSPRPGREADGRYSRAGDYDWEGQNRKTRDTKYYTEDSREQFPVRVGGGRSDYSSDFQEDNKNNSRRDTADPILRSHRNEYSRDRETQRRDVPEGEFHRSSNIPCKFFASGYCRNGNSCRFSHHGPPPTRGSPERKPQDEMFSRQDNNHSGTTERMRNSHRWNDIEKSETGKSSDNHSRTTERMRNSHRWNDIENSETGKSSEVENSRVSTVMSEAKVNNGSWIGDMEMSPDWNYGVKTRKKPVNEEHGFISQSSQSLVPKDVVAPSYEHGAATISQQDGNQRSIGMFSTVGEKAVASSHHNFSNNLVTVAPPVQTFNQNIENQSAVPYQSTPVAVGGSQVLLPGATNLSAGLNSSNPDNGNAQNTVSREELNHIGNISASLVQFFKNGQLIPQLPSTLNPKQEMQVPEVYVEKEQASHAQSDLLGNDSIIPGGIPAVTALPINNMDSHQVRLPDNVVPLDGNPKASSVDNQDKKTDEEATKEPDGKKIGEEEDIEDAENVAEEEDDGMGDENNKKEKDPKGMRAFKFALVEIIKELLKPAWKEGGMNKDAYKNIVKKVVDKVTGAIQTGNIPQTQEKIDHYLSASKPKLTKLVQAYISKVKKS